MPTASYVVDIGTNMPDGAKTAAGLDDLSRKLLDAGINAEHLHDAVALASNAFTQAEAKAAACTAALKEGNAEFGRLEQAALQAAKAQEKSAKLGVVPPQVAQELAAASAALEAHTGKLRGLEAAASAASKEEQRLGVALTNTKQAQAAGLAALRSRAEAQAKAAAGADAAARKSEREAESMVPLVKNFNDLGDAMSTSKGQAILAIGAMTAVAAAVAAVTLALIAGTVALAAWAVGLADSNRGAALSQQAVAALHPEIAALGGMYGALTDETGQSTSALNGLVKQLKAAKVAAADMPAALRAAATAETALAGNGGASEFLADIKAGKVAVGELAAATQAKLGGIVAKQMMGLDAQSTKLKKNIGDLFGGLNIDPVLEGVRVLVDLFDQNTAAGEAMKFLFETVFQPIIDQATNAAYVVEAFALGFLIGMTKLYIALKPAIKAVKEFFGFDDSSLTDTLDIAKTAGEFVASAFLVFIGILGALGVVMVAAVAWVMAPIAALGLLSVGVYKAGTAIYDGFVSAWHAVGDFLSGFSLVQIGTDIVSGLIDGIINMGPNVLKAITGIADGAINAAKKALGIASPSKVFAEIGAYTAEGFSQGVDDTAPEAQASLSEMVEPPKPVGGSSTSTTTNTSSRGPLIVNINGADSNVAAQLLQILESWAGQGGGASPEPA